MNFMEAVKTPLNIVLISGISGSGKSSALKILEDRGFFCVDNMPILLLPKFFEVALEARLKNVLFVVDIREQGFLDTFEEYIDFLKSRSSFFRFIFFDARDDTVIKRYSETRRKHPLSEEKSIKSAIEKERLLLQDIKKFADVVIDTSEISIHDLSSVVLPYVESVSLGNDLSVRIMSFGFKFGIPLEADTVFDVRFLPNPFFVPALKDFSGTDEAVGKYILSFKETDRFLEVICDFLKFSLPLYKKENKSYFTIAIGCTGGVHRSVVIVNELKKLLVQENRMYQISYFHRDKDKK